MATEARETLKKRKAYFKRQCKKVELKPSRALIQQFLALMEGTDKENETKARKAAAKALLA